MGRRKTGTKSITDSFSYSVNDINVILENEKLADTNGLSFSAYMVQLLKENLERKKVIDPIEPNAIGIIYNDQETLATTTVTEKPKEPTLEDYLKSLNELPQIYESLDAQQVDKLEATLLMRLKEVKDRSIYMRRKALHDRIYDNKNSHDIPINNQIITSNGINK